MNEDRSSYLWLRIMGSLAIIACVYKVSVTLLNQQGSAFLFLRQGAFGLFGLCLLFCGFNWKWIGLTVGIGSLACLFAIDLVKWKHGEMSFLGALLPWFLITFIMYFFNQVRYP